MRATLTIIRYRKRFIPFALLAMAILRLPLWLNSTISFWKLLGCGRNGSFDKTPDWQQWGILTVSKREPEIEDSSSAIGIEKTQAPNYESETTNALLRACYGKFITGWLRFFKCEVWSISLEAIEGHGLWDGKMAFGELPLKSDFEGPIAILTRATIRLTKLVYFWKNVAGVASTMAGANGFINSVGIGEMPFIKQATFSIWQSKNDMKNFAYQMKAHKDVIAKTRKEKWYSEDMFVRFKIIKSTGTIKGINPLNGML